MARRARRCVRPDGGDDSLVAWAQGGNAGCNDADVDLPRSIVPIRNRLPGRVLVDVLVIQDCPDDTKGCSTKCRMIISAALESGLLKMTYTRPRPMSPQRPTLRLNEI